MVKKFILVGTLLITPLVLGACMAGIVPAGPERAEALLDSTAGNSVSGKVSMTQTSKRLRVVAEVSGLPPGAHAIRIHEKGDCSAPDASSAGDYFRPPGVPASPIPGGPFRMTTEMAGRYGLLPPASPTNAPSSRTGTLRGNPVAPNR